MEVKWPMQFTKPRTGRDDVHQEEEEKNPRAHSWKAAAQLKTSSPHIALFLTFTTASPICKKEREGVPNDDRDAIVCVCVCVCATQQYKVQEQGGLVSLPLSLYPYSHLFFVSIYSDGYTDSFVSFFTASGLP